MMPSIGRRVVDQYVLYIGLELQYSKNVPFTGLKGWLKLRKVAVKHSQGWEFAFSLIALRSFAQNPSF